MAIQRVGVRELKSNASALLRRVRESQEVIEVTVQGVPVARIVPIPTPPTDNDTARWLAEWDDLVSQIEAAGEPFDTVAAVRESRRDL